jgi:hypothetical protein
MFTITGGSAHAPGCQNDTPLLERGFNDIDQETRISSPTPAMQMLIVIPNIVTRIRSLTQSTCLQLSSTESTPGPALADLAVLIYKSIVPFWNIVWRLSTAHWVHCGQC